MKRIDRIAANGDIREHLVQDEALDQRGNLVAGARALCGLTANGPGGWQAAIGNAPCVSCQRVERMLGQRAEILAPGVGHVADVFAALEARAKR